MSSGYRGTSLEQDSKWMNKHNKLKYPSIYQTKIDMNLIEFDTIKPWINQRITKLVGIEDEILISMIYNLLQDTRYPDPKLIHVQLMGFLESNTEIFMTELWNMLINSQH